MNGIIEWVLFLALAVIAVVTAAGMLVTVSMYRAGLALMSSFVALAGIFLLLDADLPAAMQIMMNVGGMLVMVLFMSMLMMDPGGAMMWEMKRSMRMRGLGAFSMRVPRGKPPAEQAEQSQQEGTGTANPQVWTCPMHPEIQAQGPGICPTCGMKLIPAEAVAPAMPMGQVSPQHVMAMDDHQAPAGQMEGMEQETHRHQMKQMGDHQGGHHQDHQMPAAEGHQAHQGHQDGEGQMGDMGGQHDHGQMGSMDAMGGMSPRQHYQMMVDMAMSTAQLPWALLLGALVGALLIALVALTPWTLSSGGPTREAAREVGVLLQLAPLMPLAQFSGSIIDTESCTPSVL